MALTVPSGAGCWSAGAGRSRDPSCERGRSRLSGPSRRGPRMGCSAIQAAQAQPRIVCAQEVCTHRPPKGLIGPRPRTPGQSGHPEAAKTERWVVLGRGDRLGGGTPQPDKLTGS